MVDRTNSTAALVDLELRGWELEREQKLEEARDTFDAALKLNPSSQSAVEGRARVAIQLDEQGAVEHCAKALAFHDSDPELQIQMIATATAGLGSAAIPLLESFLARNSQNTEAHELLAELRAQSGAGDRFIDSYNDALKRHPDDKQLLLSLWDTLTRANRLTEALESMDSKRALFGDDREFALLEANIANHAGLTDRAGKVLEQLDERPDAQLARGQHRLQTNRADEGAMLLEEVVQAEPYNFAAWSLLEVAWRLTGDVRHYWLAGQPGLVSELELALSKSQLADIAAMLRTIHRAKSQPIGQSVRGGTQTSGQLFLRTEPEIDLLANALGDAIRQFHSKLPPEDRQHPLLRYRNQGLAFGPSWSVRLTGGGFHAAHFHPGGVLSSACYISLPDEVAGNPEKSGWLEIGRPPAELGLDLPPLATFEPKEGHLILFPSYLFHGTRPFGDGERLTVAFDVLAVPPS